MQKLLSYLGLEKQSKSVRDHFYATNMRASIYMSIVVIVLEIWMMIRMTRTLIVNDLMGNFSHYFEKYYINYILLLTAGIVMFIFSVRFLRGKTDKKAVGLFLLYAFSFICLYFGIKVSINDYAKGEQILTFLTMEIFVVCLLIWKPIVGFLIHSSAYIYFYIRINSMVAVNTGEVGTTVATQINLFTMWISTMMFIISNYNKTLSQAQKDENLEKMNSYLRRISVIDDLTGIHNMLYFRTEAEKILSMVTTDRRNTVFLFLDIENFKSYNEKYGFQAGNELLKTFAELLEKNFEGSLVSRFSDDHFVLLTTIEGCQETINRLSDEIRHLQGEVQLSLKCGAYRPEDSERDPSQACDRARFACNNIKKHFGKSFCMYDASLEQRFQQKQHIVNNIDSAIENGYIKVYYQPVMNTANGCICGLEALARWEDPEYGLLPPGAFIEILEEYRQIHKLDRCIIEQVCRDYRAAADEHEPFVPVSLNFSRLDFELCDIVGFLCEVSDKYRVPRNYLDIEITESALTDQQSFLQTAMKKLHDAGFKIWLDDFGSGYSSLNVLKDYQFDVMKIDMKFLSGFGVNDKTSTILQNIVGLTKQLSMVSLTEGVESPEQFDFLRDIGCDRAQGYLFSKPVPLSELREKIDSGELRVSPEFVPA
ncbi:MAG: EAL domain-containing protein [Ruminococcus sp.]|nr:EAL domain-containing protein [Ruminococcus sp.]